MLSGKKKVVVLLKQSAMERYERLPRDPCVINLDTLAFNHDQTSIDPLDLTTGQLLASWM
jgi:hypothetical protein